MRAWIRVLLGLASMAAATVVAAPARAAPAPGASPYSAPLFTTLGTREGLPNASVSSIAEDAQGFLWFGTQGGLARYDGYDFKLFGHIPFDPTSLPHDLVQTICLDGDLLWAGTYGGLGRLDLKTERFVSYANNPSREDSLSNDVVTAIARDRRGSLWVGTLAGLNLLDEASGKFRRFRQAAGDPGSLPSDIVRALKVDHEGRLWVGTSGGGLALFDYGTGRFKSWRRPPSEAGAGKAGRASFPLSDYVMSIDEDSSGGLWLGTWYGGLSRFDPTTGIFENHPTEDDRVYSVCAAVDGLVYVGTWGGGLFEYDIAAGTFGRYRAGSSSGSLSHDVVYSILKDSSGDMWIGTNGGGVSKLGGAGRSFESISAGPGSIPPGKIYAVLVDRRGYLWVSVYNEGLARRDPATGQWRRYRRAPGSPGSLPNDIVNFLSEDAQGGIWAGTNDGLARYDAASDSFFVLRPLAGSTPSLSSEIVYAMQDDPEGGSWIGTFHSGLDHWTAGRGGRPPAFEHYAYDPANQSSLSDNLVYALAYDARGRLWIGTNRGLNRLEAPDGAEGRRFVRYIYDSAKPGGVSSDSIKTLFLDSRQDLWAGSAGGGLMRYEPETDSFVNYTKKDGLPSNSVLRILEDGSHNLWISTQAGMAVYDRGSGRFRALSLFNELRSAEFFTGAFRASDGSLYFGALNKLYRFDPELYAFNDHKPPVAFSSIKAGGRPVIGATAASRLGLLDLSWRGNSVTFDFAALDYRDPERNRYTCRLEGFDAQWSPVGPGRSATYTNLPGGHYLFRVRASNNDGLWNEEGLALPVRVGFPPWANPLAYILYAVLLGGGGYLAASLVARGSLRSARAESDALLLKLIDTSASMESAATMDALTGMPNRLKLQEHLDLAFARSVLKKLELAVVMVDIDHFKPYNDRHGRSEGEECLRRVAAALKGCIHRSSDLVGRFGGEEFLFILEETGIEGALAEGEAARKAVEDLAIARGDSRPGPVVTVSVGCAALHPDAGHSPAYLVDAAEKALMAAKQRGRNRISD